MRMRKTLAATAVGLCGVLTGCGAEVHVQREAGTQVINLNENANLVVRTDGVNAVLPEGAAVAQSAKDGAPIHRELHGTDGSLLFAYDLKVTKTGAGGSYQFLLKPAAGRGPTFASSRQVTVKPGEDLVRVELMEQPETGRKIADVFRIVQAEEVSFGTHLMRVHNAIFRWIHGS